MRKKDNIMDYTTAAFRLYAANGERSYEATKKAIYDGALLAAAKSACTPEQAQQKALKKVDEYAGVLSDILSVEKTLQLLTMGDRDYISNAVKAVYFIEPLRPLRRNDISLRVAAYSRCGHVDIRTVYRYLRTARELCGYIRGLRVDNYHPPKDVTHGTTKSGIITTV